MENKETPEGKVIAAATKASRKSVRRAAEEAGISEGRWRQVVKGYQSVSADVTIPVRAPAGTLAKMAQAVNVSAEELRSAGREDAARELVELEDNAKGYQWGEQALRARVGELARYRREERGLSRAQLATRVGISQKQTIQDFEAGERSPFPQTLRKIENGLEWKAGAIDDALRSGKRASDVQMDDMDRFDRDQKVDMLSSVGDEELLEELINRLSLMKLNIARSKRSYAAPQGSCSLAVTSNPEHREDAEDEAR